MSDTVTCFMTFHLGITALALSMFRELETARTRSRSRARLKVLIGPCSVKSNILKSDAPIFQRRNEK